MAATGWRTKALAAVLGALAGCRDPNVGPPPRKLDAEQARRASAHLLPQRPAPKQPASATLGGGAIRFLGTQLLPQTAPRGTTVRATHYFECLAPIDKSWKIFVHIEGAGAPGIILVNADHVPADGLLPTDRWKPGQIIEDEYTFSVPADAPTELVGHLGFYRYDDRLPVDDRAAHDGKNRIAAFRLSVAGEPSSLP